MDDKPSLIGAWSGHQFSFSFSSCGATMEAVAGMLLHSTALRPVSCTGPMRIPGVCVCEMCVCVRVM